MRVAVVIDGVETIRQFHSDAGEFVVDTIETMQLGDRNPGCTVFGDTNIDELLVALRARAFDLVVFTSNSLRHRDGRMARAIWRDRHALDTYLRCDGSVIVLHQYTDEPLPVAVSPGQDLRFLKTTAPTRFPALESANQTLFDLPHRIESLDLSTSGQLEQIPHWIAVHPEVANAMSVLIGSDEQGMLVGLSSPEQQGRVIACSYPLDWHRARRTLQNLVRFAVNGDEPWIVGAAADGALPPITRGVLSLRARAEVVRAPADHPWVEELATTHVYATRHDLESALRRDPVRSSVRRGGVHLCVEAGTDGSTTVIAHVGSRFHHFAGVFRTHVELTDDWTAGTDLFPKRNYLEAARFFEVSDPTLAERALVDPQLVRRLRYQGITLTSILCLSQIILAGRASESLRSEFCRDTVVPAMQLEHSDGGRLLLEAAHIGLGGDGDVHDWHLRALEYVVRAQPSAAEALRILEWCSVLASLVGTDQGDGPRVDLMSTLVRIVHANSSEGICISLEGTANLLIAVSTALPSSRAKELVAEVMDCVIAAHRGMADLAAAGEAADASLVARLCHALAAVEDLIPLGLDRLGEVIASNTKAASRGLDETHVRLLERNRQLALRHAKLEQQHIVRDRLWKIGAVAAWSLLVIFELTDLLSSAYLARRTGQYWEFSTAAVVVGAFGLWFLGSWLRTLELLPPRLASAISFLDTRFGRRRTS